MRLRSVVINVKLFKTYICVVGGVGEKHHWLPVDVVVPLLKACGREQSLQHQFPTVDYSLHNVSHADDVVWAVGCVEEPVVQSA